MGKHYKTVGTDDLEVGASFSFLGEANKEEVEYLTSICRELHKGITEIRYKNDPEAIAKHTTIIEQLKACFSTTAIYSKEIPNEFDHDIHNPWLEVITCKGKIFVGWKRAVICIDWSLSDIMVSDKGLGIGSLGERYVYASDYDKCREFLETLLQYS